MSDLLDRLPSHLGGHLQVTVLALFLGVLVSVPLAVLAVRNRQVRGPVLVVVSAIQTVPGLALLALMVPVLAFLQRTVSDGIPALGMLPAVVALTLYSMLPIVRNGVTGMLEVDPGVTDAARGIGMSEDQVLWRVRFPLALPTLMAGVRTATVWTVGMATLATPVGQVSLGNYIFAGLQTRNHGAVLFGCVLAAGLALVLDGMLAVATAALVRGRRGVPALVALGFAALGLAGLALDRPTTGPVLRVGSKPFTESHILAERLSMAFAEAGFAVERVESLGSAVVLQALEAGAIDAYVDYTGTLRTALVGETDEPAYTAVEKALRDRGVALVGPLGFENAYALAVPRDVAEREGLRSIGDLAGRPWKLGSDYEFFDRAEWTALRDGYGLGALQPVSLDPSLLYSAVRDGQVQVITAYTSDGRVRTFDLAVLDEPAGLLPPYDAVVLARVDLDPAALEALESLVGSVSLEAMQRANAAVDAEGHTPREAARLLK